MSTSNTAIDEHSNSDNTQLHGDQFDESRFKQGQHKDPSVKSLIKKVFQAKNVTTVEADEVFDNYAETKTLRQILDYSGIDYLVDTFDHPSFGINHRDHFSRRASRFDIRVETGSKAPSELDKLRKSSQWDIVPKYATRMKIPNGELEWFRIVHLPTFIYEIEKNNLEPDMKWTDESNAVTAWMYDYDELRDRGAVVYEFAP